MAIFDVFKTGILRFIIKLRQAGIEASISIFFNTLKIFVHRLSHYVMLFYIIYIIYYIIASSELHKS